MLRRREKRPILFANWIIFWKDWKCWDENELRRDNAQWKIVRNEARQLNTKTVIYQPPIEDCSVCKKSNTHNWMANNEENKRKFRVCDHFRVATHAPFHTTVSFRQVSEIESKWNSHFITAIFALDKQSNSTFQW